MTAPPGPSILVVLPTFRRLIPVRWSLTSVLMAELPANTRRARVIVVNNAPELRDALDAVVERTKREVGDLGRWELSVQHRPVSLPPVRNWYSAIEEHAQEGDIVFLPGDDDIMLPWGISSRLVFPGSMLLCRCMHDLWFDEANDTALWHPETTLPVMSPVVISSAEQISQYGASSINNHAYRWDAVTRSAIAVARAWCASLADTSENTRTLLFPEYLYYAAARHTDAVAVLDAPCTIRGQSLDVVAAAPFGVPSWNTGQMSIAALALAPTIEEALGTPLPGFRHLHGRSIADWAATFLALPRNSRGDLFAPWSRRIVTAAIRRFPYAAIRSVKRLTRALVPKATRRVLMLRRLQSRSRFDSPAFLYEASGAQRPVSAIERRSEARLTR